MAEKLSGKKVLLVGGGQTAGETVGNGRASALVYAREGAEVAVADRSIESAQQTVDLIIAEGGKAFALAGDVTSEASIIKMVADAHERMGRIDVLHNNVGVSLAGGDAVITEITEASFDLVTKINITGMVLTCKYVLPIMMKQRSGVITSIGSLASLIDYPYIAYKTSKAAVVAMTENIAIRYAEHGVRANAILPGLMETPMAIENRVGLNGKTREQVIAERNSHVPLLNKMGTGWDVAHAAAFLASDDAGFITGVSLAIDGGQALRAG
jgi:NAD(P)-dependent dehydrogenase (short-subunit alcohol dehydrogenase family)